MYDEPLIEERVDSLENILGEFIIQTKASFKRTDASLNRLSREMREFKDEMSDFKNEMSDFKNEMSDFKGEMSDFKNEMSDFKGEMSDFKDEMRQDRKAMNKQWGKLANKMGSLVEDIVAPAVRPVVRRYFGQDIECFSVRVRKSDKALDLKGEFDVIAVSGDTVFLVETKSSPDEGYLHQFVKKMEKFGKLFPEYRDMRLVPIFASLRFDEKLVRLAGEKNIYVLAYREWDYMDILNFDDVDPGAM